MNRIRKLFFASALLFSSALSNCNVKGMNIDDLPVVEVKEGHEIKVFDHSRKKYVKLSKNNDSKVSPEDFKKHLYEELSRRDFFVSRSKATKEGGVEYITRYYSPNLNNSYLDNFYVEHCINFLSKVDFNELVVDNERLNDNTNHENLKIEEKLGFKIIYLMLANMCIDWLVHNRKINEIYDGNCNNDNFNWRELINSAKKLENLNSSYVSNYIKESLINGRKAQLWRDCGYYDHGILFDDNIFLSSNLQSDITLPRFSCDYDENSRTVTFRFFKKTGENKQPMMIVIREADPGIFTSGVKNYEIFFYDEGGYCFMISGNYLDDVKKVKSTICLLSV